MKQPRRKKGLFIIITYLALLLAGCAQGGSPQATPEPGQRVVFMAGYRAQANLPFVGVYVAQEKGFFAQEGLEVEILHSGGQGEHYRLLAARQIDVTTAPAEDVLKQVGGGLPFLSIALIGQRGDRAFAVLESSGIQDPIDWEGRTVGYKVFTTPDYLAILRARGVDRSKIREVSVGFDPRVLIQGQVEVYPVFISNEPDTLRSLGYPVRLFAAADYGIPTLGLTYITHRELLQEKEAILAKFLAAALKGIYYANEHPQEAIDIVLKYAPEEQRVHQLYMLEKELESAQSPLTQEKGLGWQRAEQWQALQDTMLEFGGLDREVEVGQAFSDALLEQAYRQGPLTP